jgi:uncharacterized protein (TIGR03084 family)
MNDRLAGVLADLLAEGDQLEDLVVPLDDEGWRAPTPAAGWDVAHQVAHLAWTDETAVAAATDPEAWHATLRAALADPDGFVDAAAERGAAATPAALLDRWRAARAGLVTALSRAPEGTRLPWYGPPMSPTSMATARFMETWAHARDVAAGLGVELPADDRVRHVVHLGVRTRAFSYANRGLEPPTADVRVSLTLPSGAPLDLGPADADQVVAGSAYDFALVVTRRLHRADADLTATGPEADAWLDIAQAFAGPPGPGRPARA